MQKIFGTSFKQDTKITILTIISTILIMMDYYLSPLLPWEEWFPLWSREGFSTRVFDRTFLYFIIPMIIIVVIFKEKPKDYGFTLGDWKAGVLITIAAIILVAPLLWLVGRSNPAIKSFYAPMASGVPWNTLLDLFGWEFLFRGFLLFGYARKFDGNALWLQSVPFALAHLGKPGLETFSTIFGGFAFGWVAWRTKSFVYPLIIHWFVASFIIVITAG